MQIKQLGIIKENIFRHPDQSSQAVWNASFKQNAVLKVWVFNGDEMSVWAKSLMKSEYFELNCHSVTILICLSYCNKSQHWCFIDRTHAIVSSYLKVCLLFLKPWMQSDPGSCLVTDVPDWNVFNNQTHAWIWPCYCVCAFVCLCVTFTLYL